jgi:putative DNA primase/helicase
LTPQELADRLHARSTGPGQWHARCPAHDDRKPSLSIGTGKNGAIVLTCHRGCATEDILKAEGLEWRDLWPDDELSHLNGHRQNGHKPAAAQASPRRIVETYPYCDEDGTLLYQVVRYDPKDFKQRRPARPDDEPRMVSRDGWVWSIRDVRWVAYRLPELLADTSGELWLFEGEKDANRAASLGLNATTTAQGAASFDRSADALRAVAAGRRVYAVRDEDEAGIGYVAAARIALKPVATSFRALRLPRLTYADKHGEDFSDWLAKYGGSVEELRQLAGTFDDATSASNSKGTSTSSTDTEPPVTDEPSVESSQERRKLRLLTVREVLDQPIPDPS